MRQTKNPPVWTTAPERRYSDVVSPTPGGSTEWMEEALQIGLDALTTAASASLIVPPRKAFAPRRAGGRKDLHFHRYVEVGIILRGEMTLWWEGVTARCPTGSIFVIPPGTRYLPHVLDTDRPAPPHSVLWLALHRGSAIAHRCILEGKTHRLSEYYCFTETRVTAQARHLAQELADRSPDFEIVLRGSLLCLLTWLRRAPVHGLSRRQETRSDPQSDRQDSFQERVESYLLSHYHRPITLAQVARSIGCSPAYLCRHFREVTGQTPFQYLRTVRIEAAKRLLLSEVPIARVAEMVGFDDPLYFSKVFSRHTGVSPLGYRKQEHT